MTDSTQSLSSTNRALQELDEEHERVLAQIPMILERIARDPVSALNLRYTKTEGLTADPIPIKSKILDARINSLPEAPKGSKDQWSPAAYREGTVSVEPCGFWIAPFGTVVALTVSHEDPDFRLKLDWFKKSDPASGPVYLVDSVNHEYLYPIASSLKGEVIAGVPRTGVLVFPRLRAPTDRLQLHFSGVSAIRGSRSSFHFFEFQDRGLPAKIEEAIGGPTPMERIEAALDVEVRKVRSEFLRQRSDGSGCGAALLLLALLVGGGAWLLTR